MKNCQEETKGNESGPADEVGGMKNGTNENKIDRERQRVGASAQNEWQRGAEANMRRSPKLGRGGAGMENGRRGGRI
ncbi:hypothetical protein TNCV_695181 [Trichonephila clavipes]|nr:hypothetical protein TNCV_695181 [Trichonephila clavipes]